MKQTKDKFFVDSNVFLYLLSNDEKKKGIAKAILKSNPVISTQVISENINVLFKKFRMLDANEIYEHADILLNYCHVLPLTAEVVKKALEFKSKYQFQWYDCTILASADIDGCTVIYSEDMHHEQLINKTLRIINPFV